MGLHQKDSLEVRGCSGIEVSGHLPEDVGGHGAAFEDDLSPAARDDISAGFEDEHVGGGSFDGDAAGCSEIDAAAPFVHARRKSLAGDEAGPDVEVRRTTSCARSRVGVGRLHVEDGGRQHGWRGQRVVGRVADAGHLRRR